ncbi:hypothetical protein MMC24_003536 [Lignoscripta atroalba]|nr:hypothetical protein [Lignoscripta atroalba]
MTSNSASSTPPASSSRHASLLGPHAKHLATLHPDEFEHYHDACLLKHMTCKLEQHENCLVERIERQERRIEEQRGEIEELKRMIIFITTSATTTTPSSLLHPYPYPNHHTTPETSPSPSPLSLFFLPADHNNNAAEPEKEKEKTAEKEKEKKNKIKNMLLEHNPYMCNLPRGPVGFGGPVGGMR